jgi:hypothetical protein
VCVCGGVRRSRVSSFSSRFHHPAVCWYSSRPSFAVCFQFRFSSQHSNFKRTTNYFDSFLSSSAYSRCVRAFLLKLHKLTYQLRHFSPLASRNCRADKWNFMKFGKGKFQNTFLVLTNFGSNGEKKMIENFTSTYARNLKRNSLNFVRSEECSEHFPVCYGSSNTVSFRPSACTFVLLSAVHRTASKFNTREFRI